MTKFVRDGVSVELWIGDIDDCKRPAAGVYDAETNEMTKVAVFRNDAALEMFEKALVAVTNAQERK